MSRRQAQPHVAHQPSGHTTTIPEALSAATHSLSPWLTTEKHRPQSRELRFAATTLNRLHTALVMAIARETALFDRVAAADAITALLQLRDIATCARAQSAARPRIKNDWRTRDPKPASHTHIPQQYPMITADPKKPHRNRLEHSKHDPTSLMQTTSIASPVGIPIPPGAGPLPDLSLQDRRRVEVLSNRLDALLQVALWKCRHVFTSPPDARVTRTTSCVPLSTPSATAPKKGRARTPFALHRKGPGNLRSRLGRRGRIFSNAEVPTSAAPSAAPSHPHIRYSSNSLAHTNIPQPIEQPIQGHVPPPWYFSLIESPITPLRSRTLATIDDSQVIMAVWRGARVSVKVIRHDEHRFIDEADYLHSLSLCPNIPSLLGAHWEHAPTSKKKHSRSGSANVGYLIMQVANGVSLDKLVRQNKLSDTVTKIRLLERVVAALVFAQKVNPFITHQDLHPGNILLVPSSPDPHNNGNALQPLPSLDHGAPDPAPFYSSASDASTLMRKETMVRTTTNSTVVTTTDISLNKIASESSFVGSSTAVESVYEDASPRNDFVPPPVPHPSLAIPKDGRLLQDPFGPLASPPPQIPKVEDVAHALTVLERVALHDNLDEAARQEMERQEQTPARHAHEKPLHLPLVEAAQPVLSIPHRSNVHPLRNGASASRSDVDVREGTEAHPPSPPTPSTTATRTVSASTMETTHSLAMQSASATSSFMEDDQGREGSSSPMPGKKASVTAFTVKVMDFPPADEAEGRRRNVTWEVNDTLAGYCAPEKVTSTMQYRFESRQEKARERRMMMSRSYSASGSRISPQVSAKRRSTRSTREEATGSTSGRGQSHDNGIRADSMGSGTDGGITAGRSSSSSHRRPHDSETYALFGDDLEGAANTEDPDIVSADGESMECDEVGTADGDGGIWQRESDVEVKRRSTAIGRLGGDGDAISSTMEHSGDSGFWDGEMRGDEAFEAAHLAKSDVWSVGWLLYYMCTSRHPSRDAWARRDGLSDAELKEVPVECCDIIRMCVEPNVTKRACLREVKRRIDSQLQALMFVKGVALLRSEREAAFVLLDKAVGIQVCGGGAMNGRYAGCGGGKTSGSDWGWNAMDGKQGYERDEGIGLNERTRLALSTLPLVVVRRVEWEAAGRYFNVSETDMQELRRALVKGKWNKSDVKDGNTAIRYLQAHVAEGVTSGQSALGWIYRWGAGGVRKDIQKAIGLWTQAVERGHDAESGNGLGLLYHHGRADVLIDGAKARGYYEMAVDEGYPAAAVNLGVLLHDGAGKVKADGLCARQYYEMGCREGDAIAANNLGLLLHHGAVGVDADGGSARAAYEVAILRNERHHACRNLGELLWDGAEGVQRDRHLALDYFAMAINRGDGSSRAVAISRLKRLVSAVQHEVQHIGGGDGGSEKDHGDSDIVYELQGDGRGHRHRLHHHEDCGGGRKDDAEGIMLRGKQMLLEVEALHR